MAIIVERQNQNFSDDDLFDDRNSFWWSREGQIVRWSVFFGLFAFFVAFMIGGYWHAKRRLDKGLVPLGYHRWLLSRRDRARYDPAYQTPAVYYNQYPPPQHHSQYGMDPMPPPLYTNADLPPTYQPPAGATKVDPSQWRAEPTRRPVETTGEPSPAYEAPPGPTPPAVQANHTGASAVGSNPYRL